MLLLSDLGTKFINKKWIHFGIFKCLYCLQEVEKQLYNGLKAKSCGCNKRKGKTYKHGGKGTKLYKIWQGIKSRILNSNSKQYKDWGGRGITICPEWTESYITFRDWALNNGYQEGLQINRINNNGNYEPFNCNFVTAKENARNRRSNVATLAIANKIRELYKTGGYSQRYLAYKFNMSKGNITFIINNKTWKDG